jgi:hypothetical protein
MKNGLRRRFWPEAALSVVTAALFVFTLVRRDWIEVLFGVDPDQHNGTLELLIVGALLVVTVTLISMATYEWRRAVAAAA